MTIMLISMMPLANAAEPVVTRRQIASDIMNLYNDITKTHSSVSIGRGDGIYDDIPNAGLAIEWCSVTGIMIGTAERIFEPDGVVTREQAATVMYRFLRYLDNHSRSTFADFDEASIPEENRFADDNCISSWAKYSVYAIQVMGIIEGDENHMFKPQENLSVDEESLILSRIKSKYTDEE